MAIFGQSERVYLIRLSGVYDREREGARRMIRAAKEKYGLDYPWKKPEGWTQWWKDNWYAIGQAPSQMFLYYVIRRDLENLQELLASERAQRLLRFKYDRKTVTVLDMYTAQLQYEDQNPSDAAKILAKLELLHRWFVEFELWFNEIKMARVPRIPPSSATKIALFIASAVEVWGTPDKLHDSQWQAVQVFLTQGPRQIKTAIGVEYPIAKGKWPGQKNQIDATVKICQQIATM